MVGLRMRYTYHIKKHFTRNGKKVIEYYVDDVLETYFETEETNDGAFIEKGFGNNDELFCFRKYRVFDGYEINIEEWVINIDGTKTEGEVGIPHKKIDRF